MPLDSNLPTYYFKPPTDKNRPFQSTLHFTQFDSDPEPRYTHKYLDPSNPQGRNCYDVAIADPYIPDVVFGEILVKPEWTQQSLSAEEVRKAGGVPPPPAPVIPRSVAVQLYAPDQQVVMEEDKGSWGTGPSYHFSMPQQTFRLPSSSVLDYGANDPAADPSTPLINFLWKRDGRKDLKCYVTGKSTDKGKKKKGGKEPPIIVAMFRDFNELTIYEPNLHRVEMEDYKGLEIVLLLTSTVIRDIYCGYRKDPFNAGQAPRKNSSGALARKKSTTLLQANASTANLLGSSGAPGALQPNGLAAKTKRRPSIPQPVRAESYPSGVPPPDPRQQWEIDAETARLRKIYEVERQAEEKRRRERMLRDEEEARRIQKQLELEEKERRKKQAAVEKESERLRKIYGKQQDLRPPQAPGPRQSYPPWGHAPVRPPQQPPRPVQNHGPYLQPNGMATQSLFFGRPVPQHTYPSAAASSINLTMSGARPPMPNGRPPAQHPGIHPKKSSFFGFLTKEPQPSLRGQRSTMF